MLRKSRNNTVNCLFLATEAFGGKGGISQFNRDFMQALDCCVEIDRVIALPRLGKARVPFKHMTVVQLKPRYNAIQFSIAALFTCLWSRPKIVVSAHLYHGPLALLVARLTGARLISVLHGTEIWRKISSIHRFPLKQSDLVICVSADTRAHYLRHVGHDYSRNVSVLPNTVDERFFPRNKDEARRRFGVDELPVVLSVGRLDGRAGYKGHDKVISVMKCLKSEGFLVRYLIAGDGPDRQRLESLVTEAGVNELVHFLGYVPDEALPDLYSAADVFALPSKGEGFGIVFIEAMACGTPAIGLDVGGAKEALAPPGIAVNEEEFPKRMSDMLRNPENTRSEMSRATIERFGRPRFNKSVRSILDAFLFD